MIHVVEVFKEETKQKKIEERSELSCLILI